MKSKPLDEPPCLIPIFEFMMAVFKIFFVFLYIACKALSITRPHPSLASRLKSLTLYIYLPKHCLHLAWCSMQENLTFEEILIFGFFPKTKSINLVCQSLYVVCILSFIFFTKIMIILHGYFLVKHEQSWNVLHNILDYHQLHLDSGHRCTVH